MSPKVLIVATSHGLLGNTGEPTGCWVEELASPYYLWLEKGFHVDIASVKGGAIPWDPASESGVFCTEEASQFINDAKGQELVNNSKSVAEVLAGDVKQYDALFLPGGHGIVYDGPNSSELKQLIEAFWDAGKIVSAVCHGPVGLVSACGRDGKSIFNGKRCTGFTNSEEIEVQKEKFVPFLLEDRIIELGGKYESGPNWVSFVIRDGQLITGQNPGSSKALAEEVANALA